MDSLISTLGRIARFGYQILPLNWRLRQAVKDRLFSWLAPLLKNTASFKRWQSFGNGQRLPQLPRPAPTRASGDPPTRIPMSPSERYLADQFAHVATEPCESYAPITTETSPPGHLSAKAIAFYLPQFHRIPENDAWWGKGFTEWTNVTKAVPQFVGHHQPRLPGELGYYDLRVIDVMRRQAELAKLYGLHGFCFHYYWFSGRKLLSLPLDQYVADPETDFPFCLSWANENWTRRWDGKSEDVLVQQDHSEADDLDFIRNVAPYLADRRYIRLEGRPLLIVYRPSLLPDCRRTLIRWREYCRAVGIGEIFLAMVQFDVCEPTRHGFDAAIEYPPHVIAVDLPFISHSLEIVNPAYAGAVLDYKDIVAAYRDLREPNYPLFRGVFPGWDNEARRPGKGYTFARSTPALYAQWLQMAVDKARARPVQGENVVFINAWNEWAEGAYLEPDRKFGYAYLQATRDVLAGSGQRPPPTMQHQRIEAGKWMHTHAA